MCKLEGVKWCVVKSNKPISKRLSNCLSKIRFGFVQDNTFSFYYFNDEEFNKVVELLKLYKQLQFEVVKFYDKQFGLTVNSWGNIDKDKINNLPLSYKFIWFNPQSNRQSVTPITKKQFDSIIRIN